MLINILLLLLWLFFLFFYIYLYSKSTSKSNLFWIIMSVFWIILETIQILNHLIYPIIYKPILQTMFLFYLLWLSISLFFFIHDLTESITLLQTNPQDNIFLIISNLILSLIWAYNIYHYTPLLLQTLCLSGA